MSILNHLIATRVSKHPPHARQMLTLGGNPNLQLLNPMQEWDWQVTLDGSISLGQFQFCDFMPTNPEADTYSMSGSSLHQAYQFFLEQIADQFSVQSYLNKLIEPTFSPANGSAPDGWVKVADGSNKLQWRPIYDVVDMPEDLDRTELSSTHGPIQIPIFGLPLSIFTVTDGQENQTTIKQEQIRELSLFVDAWERVPIGTGSWFNNSIINFAKSRALSSPDKYSVEGLIGPNEVLSSRVSEMLIAYNPSLTIEIANEVLGNDLLGDQIKEVMVEGLSIEEPILTKQQSGEETLKFQLAAKKDKPYIMGVFVERFYDSISPLSFPVSPGRSMARSFLMTEKQSFLPKKNLQFQVDGKLILSTEGKHHLKIKTLL